MAIYQNVFTIRPIEYPSLDESILGTGTNSNSFNQGLFNNAGGSTNNGFTGYNSCESNPVSSSYSNWGYMKMITTILICSATVFLGVYSYTNIRWEKDFKKVKEGQIKREEVIKILGEPLRREKNDEVSDAIDVFNTYKKINKASKSKKQKETIECLKPGLQEIYQGNTCIFFCPTFMEDQVIVDYNKQGLVCRVRRIGL